MDLEVDRAIQDDFRNRAPVDFDHSFRAFSFDVIRRHGVLDDESQALRENLASHRSTTLVLVEVDGALAGAVRERDVQVPPLIVLPDKL